MGSVDRSGMTDLSTLIEDLKAAKEGSRELPEAEVSLNIYGMSFAMVYNGGGPSKEVEHHHTLPAVAVLLALLDAKEIE